MTTASLLSNADIAYVKAQFVPLSDLCDAAGVSVGDVRNAIAAGVRPAPPYPGLEYVPADYLTLPTAEEFKRDWRGPDLSDALRGYLDGTFFVCLRQATPANIRRKGELVEKIRELAGQPSCGNPTWRHELRVAVDELDELERPFSPDYDRTQFGRPPTRDELITDIRAAYPELWS